jgi:hypothetical protein
VEIKKTLKLGYLTLGLLVQILYVGTPIVLSLALRDAGDDSPHFFEQESLFKDHCVDEKFRWIVYADYNSCSTTFYDI